MWTSSKQRGDAAEDEALRYLQAQGLHLVRRNFKTPGRGGGEVDLIMREPDGTLVFVEVRQRAVALHDHPALPIRRGALARPTGRPGLHGDLGPSCF
ncbi:MAG: hypothetical protein RJA56_995 [Pseudomonadota bacterium]